MELPSDDRHICPGETKTTLRLEWNNLHRLVSRLFLFVLVSLIFTFSKFLKGQYVKIVLTGIPSTFRTKISKTPVLIGGLPNLETGTGIVQVRIKKHRWFERILKSKDALIISAGWRRFQTLPVYYMDEDNGRHRFLKVRNLLIVKSLTSIDCALIFAFPPSTCFSTHQSICIVTCNIPAIYSQRIPGYAAFVGWIMSAVFVWYVNLLVP